MRLQPLPDFEPFGQPVIAETKVRYVGEAIAVVLADTAGIAEDALGLIDVDIERCRRSPTATPRRGRIAAVRGRGHQSRDQVPRCARRRRRRVPRRDHAARELPHPAAHGAADGAARPAGGMGRARGRLTVSGGAKVLFFNRRTLAKQMDGPRTRSRSSRTMSAAASAREASSTWRTFSSRSRHALPAGR